MTIATNLKRYEYPAGSGRYRLLNDRDAKTLGVAGKGSTDGLKPVEEALADDTTREPSILASADAKGEQAPEPEPSPVDEPTGDEAEQKKRSVRR